MRINNLQLIIIHLMTNTQRQQRILDYTDVPVRFVCLNLNASVSMSIQCEEAPHHHHQHAHCVVQSSFCRSYGKHNNNLNIISLFNADLFVCTLSASIGITSNRVVFVAPIFHSIPINAEQLYANISTGYYVPCSINWKRSWFIRNLYVWLTLKAISINSNANLNVKWCR